MKSKICISLLSLFGLCSCTTGSWLSDYSDSSSSSSSVVYYRAIGTVVDVWGNPLENIKVVINDGDTFRTESDGTYSALVAEYYGTSIKITFTDDDEYYDSNDGDYQTTTIAVASGEEPTYYDYAFQYDMGTTTLLYK